MATIREISKRNWNGDNSHRDIDSGSLQRIADATEIMAQNFIQLQNDRDMYKRWWKEQQEESARLSRRVSALQGVITKLKNKANDGWEPVPSK